MAKKQNSKSQRKNLFKGLSESAAASEVDSSDFFLLSLKHFNLEQGQSFSEWEELSLLSKAMETLRNYSCSSLINGVDNHKFTIYGDFPPKHKTEFEHPSYVPEDAQWARIHVNGATCLIGHVQQNIFHLVFLDKEHQFWKSEKKHT